MHFRTGRCVTNTEIGDAVGRTQPWVSKWAKSNNPPRDFEVHEPLATFFALDERWLIRGEGKPPEIDLWDRWISSRVGRPVGHIPTEAFRPAQRSEPKRKRDPK